MTPEQKRLREWKARRREAQRTLERALKELQEAQEWSTLGQAFQAANRAHRMRLKVG